MPLSHDADMDSSSARRQSRCVVGSIPRQRCGFASLVKAIGRVLCGVLLAGTFAAGITAQTVPPSPKVALDAYIQLQRRGATLGEWQRVVSRESFAIVSALEQATSGQLNLAERMPPEDKYASFTIIKESNTPARAIFQVMVKYKDSWLKQEAHDTRLKNDIPAAQQAGRSLISDAGPGEGAEHPYHLNGDGYVSFLFLKQDGTWRFHKSHASRQPSDFTPLLTTKDLSGGLSVTMQPAIETNPSLPKVAPNQALAGRHSGKDWRGLIAYESTSSTDQDYYGVEVVEKVEPDWVKRFSIPRLLVRIPRNPGEYKLSPTFNVTFFEPPGNNKVATEGFLKVTRDGATFKVELVARSDKDNDVRGSFTYAPSTGK
jgi:hypothetical protein